MATIGGPRRQTDTPRIRRERRTVEVMIRMYCAAHHSATPMDSDGEFPSPARGRGVRSPKSAAGLCTDCAALMAYAGRRIDACPFHQSKPTCARCTVHCFRPEMRDRIRVVMRYAGPRMALRHPYLALRHLMDRRA